MENPWVGRSVGRPVSRPVSSRRVGGGGEHDQPDVPAASGVRLSEATLHAVSVDASRCCSRIFRSPQDTCSADLDTIWGSAPSSGGTLPHGPAFHCEGSCNRGPRRDRGQLSWRTGCRPAGVSRPCLLSHWGHRPLSFRVCDPSPAVERPTQRCGGGPRVGSGRASSSGRALLSRKPMVVLSSGAALEVGRPSPLLPLVGVFSRGWCFLAFIVC